MGGPGSGPRKGGRSSRLLPNRNTAFSLKGRIVNKIRARQKKRDDKIKY